MSADTLDAFLADLRRRLERGELRGQRLWLGKEMTLTDVDGAVRALLRQVDEFRALSPAERQSDWARARRRKLADTLWRLSEVLEGRPPPANEPPRNRWG